MELVQTHNEDKRCGKWCFPFRKEIILTVVHQVHAKFWFLVNSMLGLLARDTKSMQLQEGLAGYVCYSDCHHLQTLLSADVILSPLH
jgi:hypothetical protein